MIKLLSVIGKDFKILLRSKRSALIIIVSPILIVLLIGLAFNSTTLQGVKVGVYSPSYNDLSNSIVDSFKEKDFEPKKMDSREDCIDSVRSGENQICIVFPEDISPEGSKESIIFHVDQSRINIAYTLINDVESQIVSKSSELSLTLTESLLNVVEEADKIAEKNNDVSQAITDISAIKTESDTLSTKIPSVSGVISDLNDAKSVANDLSCTNSSAVSELTGDINSAISSLTPLANESQNLTNSITNINTKSADAVESLNELKSSLGDLSSSLDDVTVKEAEKVVSPIKTEIEPITQDSSNRNYLFPTLVALMMLFSSIILSSTLVLKDKKSRAYFRNFITPTSEFTFLMGLYITCLIILILQLIILFGVAIYLIDYSIINSLLSVAVIILLAITSFVFLGMFIGYLFKSEETSILGSISIASLLMFFSNTIFPVETIASSFKILATYNPLVITDALLKKAILFHVDFISLLPELYLLLGISAIMFVLAFGARELTKRRT